MSLDAYAANLFAPARRDPRVALTVLDKLDRRRGQLAAATFELFDPVVGAGLNARRDHYVRPWMLPTPEASRDWTAWIYVSMCLRLLGGDGRTRRLCVCESCTVVFAPRRKSSARWCEICGKRPLRAMPLGAPGVSVDKRGDRARVRMPELYEGSTSRVRLHKEVTIGLCPECGAVFTGKAGIELCSDACRQARHRRVACAQTRS